MSSNCQLTEAPFYQCCCQCTYHKPIYYHCCTEPKPSEEQKKEAGIEGRCVCGVQKGWACSPLGEDGVYDNWPEHSVGCEMFNQKK